jgi:hypothetical protein
MQPNWVLTLMVPKWALANARLGVNFVPDMAPEPKYMPSDYLFLVTAAYTTKESKCIVSGAGRQIPDSIPLIMMRYVASQVFVLVTSMKYNSLRYIDRIKVQSLVFEIVERLKILIEKWSNVYLCRKI